jgi:hypothetical protein
LPETRESGKNALIIANRTSRVELLRERGCTPIESSVTPNPTRPSAMSGWVDLHLPIDTASAIGDTSRRQGFATTRAHPTRHAVAEAGRDKSGEVSSVRTTEEMAFSEFVSHIRGLFPKLSSSEEEECVSLPRDAIVAVCRKRGLSIASSLFASRSSKRFYRGSFERAEAIPGVSIASVFPLP